MSWENSPPEACSISVTIVEPVAGMSCASTRRVAPVSAGARSQADRNPIPDQYYGNSVQPLPPRSPGASAPPGAARRPRRQQPFPPVHPQYCSAMATTPDPALLADLRAALDATYAIEREIGGGGMSRVFLADERSLGRRVVLKVLPPELTAGVNRERFRREIQFAARLQHPHIVPLLAAGQVGDILYYTMPFVEGESLRNRLEKDGPMPAARVLAVLQDVVEALADAHSRGLVHRGLQPENILIQRGHALVTDFGVAKAISESLPGTAATTIGVAVGTPAYMAPEQLAADPAADHRMDLYAAGGPPPPTPPPRPPLSRGGSPDGPLRGGAPRLRAALRVLPVLRLVAPADPGPPAHRAAHATAPPAHRRAAGPLLDHHALPREGASGALRFGRRAPRGPGRGADHLLRHAGDHPDARHPGGAARPAAPARDRRAHPGAGAGRGGLCPLGAWRAGR